MDESLFCSSLFGKSRAFQNLSAAAKKSTFMQPSQYIRAVFLLFTKMVKQKASKENQLHLFLLSLFV